MKNLKNTLKEMINKTVKGFINVTTFSKKERLGMLYSELAIYEHRLNLIENLMSAKIRIGGDIKWMTDEILKLNSLIVSRRREIDKIEMKLMKMGVEF